MAWPTDLDTFFPWRRPLMHIAFINYHRFEGSSGVHIHFLANALEEMGATCTVCLPGRARRDDCFGDPLYRVASFGRTRLFRFGKRFGVGRPPDILHAWTPRENVRQLCRRLAHSLDIPYAVHLEDNEEAVLAEHVRLNPRCSPDGRGGNRLPLRLIHPERYRAFLSRASAITGVIDSLRELAPQGPPFLTLSPACEDGFFSLPPEPDPEIRAELGIGPGTLVITYPGNVHAANLQEVADLYAAVGLLNSRGISTLLLRAGSNHAPGADGLCRGEPGQVLELGPYPARDLIRLIAAADVLVQPGRPTPFNEYRLPSKLPMFLASGRPVILPEANLGRTLRNGEECVLLGDGSAEDIAGRVAWLLRHPDRARAIGGGGREFARRSFSWERTALAALALYQRILS